MVKELVPKTNKQTNKQKQKPSAINGLFKESPTFRRRSGANTNRRETRTQDGRVVLILEGYQKRLEGISNGIKGTQD